MFAELFLTLASSKVWFLLPLLKHFGCYGNLKFPLTYNRKGKLRFIAIPLQIFWQKFYKHVCWVVLHQAYRFSPNLSIWLFAIATELLTLRNFFFFLNQLVRSYKGDKSWKCAEFFIILASMKRLIIGKMKIGIYSYFIADKFEESFLEMFVKWSSVKYILLIQISQFDWLQWQP